MQKLPAFIMFALLLCTATAKAGTVVIDAVDSGWLKDDGTRLLNTAPNYLVGRCLGCVYDREARNFFVFDLSVLDGRKVVGATLLLDSGTRYSDTGRPFETYLLSDVTTPIATLLAGDPGNTALFDDLAGGVRYGEIQVDMQGGVLPPMVIPLSQDAVLALNATAGLFAFGGAVTTLGPYPEDVRIFGGTHQTPNRRQLMLTVVPVPPAIVLFLTGLLTLRVRMPRRI